jgi:putative endonuclease
LLIFNKGCHFKTFSTFLALASVYILYSKKISNYYVGSCEDVSYRHGQHLNKEYKGSFTTRVDDWEIYYYKDDLGSRQARLIERHIKRMKSQTYYQNLKIYPDIMERLMKKYK